MISRRVKLLLTVAIIAAAAFGYVSRVAVRDAWEAWRAPKLPPAKAYAPSRETAGEIVPSAPSPVEGGLSASEHYVLETNPTAKKTQGDPLAFTGKLPAEVNLDVPFTSQAPKSNWDFPYQEACEEASAIMVDGYYRGERGKIPADRADKAILAIVDFQKKNYGFYEDTTAEQTAKFIKEAYGYSRVIVKPLTSVEEIKKPLALGYPVIVPFAGKLLGNPNYRNGGPPYHMMVIRGYTVDKFITNDPGTRKGEGYLYDPLTIMNAAHDWTGSKDTVSTGKAYMIVVLPN